MAPLADIWAGDVLVVGAGSAGALLASRLSGRHAVSLIDQAGFGAGQSNHSHGYVHRGHIYISGATGLATSLREGAERWRTLLRTMDCFPVATESTVGFGDPIAASNARATWRRAKLPVRRRDVPTGLDGSLVTNCFATDEEAYDFTSMFVRLRETLSETMQAKAVVKRLLVDAGHVTGVEVRLGDGTRARLRSHLYVLAAGASNAGLLRSATRHRGRAISRMSFMAIAAGRELPPISLILPGNAYYGLFIVSRPLRGGGHAWLMSNFLSLAFDGRTPHAGRLWLRSLLRSVGAVAPVLHDPTLRWGLYEAPKGELRDTPGVMSGHSYETFGLDNLLALAPTKLTLAPLLAEEVGDVARGRLAALTPTSSELPRESLPVSPERWLGETLVPLDEFLTARGCPDSAQALWRPGPAVTVA